MTPLTHQEKFTLLITIANSAGLDSNIVELCNRDPALFGKPGSNKRIEFSKYFSNLKRGGETSYRKQLRKYQVPGYQTMSASEDESSVSSGDNTSDKEVMQGNVNEYQASNNVDDVAAHLEHFKLTSPPRMPHPCMEFNVSP